ncbi:hypothetical protein PT2222_70067 [Paraburkholderia tropica]
MRKTRYASGVSRRGAEPNSAMGTHVNRRALAHYSASIKFVFRFACGAIETLIETPDTLIRSGRRFRHHAANAEKGVVGTKHITVAITRLNILTAARRQAQQLAQTKHDHVETARMQLRIAIELAQNALARQRTHAVRGEHRQHRQRERRRGNARAVLEQLIVDGIEFEAVEFVARLFRRRIGQVDLAAQRVAHACEQLARIERIDEVIVGAQFEGQHLVGHIGAFAHDDHRHRMPAFAQTAQRGDAVAVARVVTHQDQRGHLAREALFQPLGAVQHRHGDLLTLQITAQIVAVTLIGFHHQHMNVHRSVPH